MTSRDFCYWLQGALEVTNAKSLNEEQLEVVRKHLSLVFVHEIDPSHKAPPGRTEAEHQKLLNSFHANKGPILRC